MQFISLTEPCPVRVAVAVHGKIFRTTTLSSVKGLLFVKQWMFSQTQLDIIVYECWWPHISDTAKRGGCQSGTVSLIRKTHDVLDDPQQWKHQRGWNALGFLPIGGRWGPQVYEDSGFEDWFWSRVVRFCHVVLRRFSSLRQEAQTVKRFSLMSSTDCRWDDYCEWHLTPLPFGVTVWQ